MSEAVLTVENTDVFHVAVFSTSFRETHVQCGESEKFLIKDLGLFFLASPVKAKYCENLEETRRAGDYFYHVADEKKSAKAVF